MFELSDRIRAGFHCARNMHDENWGGVCYLVGQIVLMVSGLFVVDPLSIIAMIADVKSSWIFIKAGSKPTDQEGIKSDVAQPEDIRSDAKGSIIGGACLFMLGFSHACADNRAIRWITFGQGLLWSVRALRYPMTQLAKKNQVRYPRAASLLHAASNGLKAGTATANFVLRPFVAFGRDADDWRMIFVQGFCGAGDILRGQVLPPGYGAINLKRWERYSIRVPVEEFLRSGSSELATAIPAVADAPQLPPKTMAAVCAIGRGPKIAG